jgi:Neocarzinostatin family
MPRRTVPRRNQTCLAGLALVAAIGGSIAAATNAAASSGITVTPRTGLANNDVVTVSATGLPGNSSFDIDECQLAVTAANPANPGPGCAPDGASVFTSASGVLPSTDLTVLTGQIGSDSGSVCTEATNGACGIVIASHGFGVVYGTVTVSFGQLTEATKTRSAASKSTVPAGRHFTVAGLVTGGGKGANGLKVSLYRRASSHHSSAKTAKTTTKTIKGARGSYSFGLKGLKHSEQYQARHKTQKIGSTTYRASVGRTITIRP